MVSNKKIGILGGGQLGAMLIRHAIDFGADVSVMDKSADAACAKYTGSFTVGDLLNYNDVVNFGKDLDVVTIEIEAVNVEALKHLRSLGVQVFPQPETLALIQDKYLQKQFLQSHQIPVVQGWLIHHKAELQGYIDKLPACLKKCKDGYDGKGVLLLHTPEDFAQAFKEPSVLEALVAIRQEISVIVARNAKGELVCYEPVAMVFDPKLMLLDYQVCPSGIEPHLLAQAEAIAKQVAEAIDLQGIMAVEMFVDKQGNLFVNELAPRPHNSGHHTIEAAITSQFEQHVRILLGLPLGSTQTTSASVMINLLEPKAEHKEAMQQGMQEVLARPQAHLHWYGKSPGKPGRKMGHITVLAASQEEAVQRSNNIRKQLKQNHE